MYKKFLTIAAFAFSLVLSQTTFADSWGCGEGLKTMVESLKLDDGQKAKIKPILEQLQSVLKDKGTQMKALRAQIHQQIMSANMDQSTVDGLIDKKIGLIGDIIKAKIAAQAQIVSILTPQQKMEFQNKVKTAEEKMVAKFKNCDEKD